VRGSFEEVVVEPCLFNITANNLIASYEDARFEETACKRLIIP
jgi:hypothetical protein